MKYIVALLLLGAFTVPTFAQDSHEVKKKSESAGFKTGRIAPDKSPTHSHKHECGKCEALKKEIVGLKKRMEAMGKRAKKAASDKRGKAHKGWDKRGKAHRGHDRKRGAQGHRRGGGGDWSDALQRDGIIPLSDIDKLDPDIIRKAIRDRMGSDNLNRFEHMRKWWTDRKNVG